MTSKEMARATLLETDVAAGVASAAYVAANAKRLALYLASSPTAALTYSTDAVAVLNNGIDIPAGTVGMWLDFATHGPAVTAAWNSIAAGAIAAGITSIEVLRAE